MERPALEREPQHLHVVGDGGVGPLAERQLRDDRKTSQHVRAGAPRMYVLHSESLPPRNTGYGHAHADIRNLSGWRTPGCPLLSRRW